MLSLAEPECIRRLTLDAIKLDEQRQGGARKIQGVGVEAGGSRRVTVKHWQYRQTRISHVCLALADNSALLPLRPPSLTLQHSLTLNDPSLTPKHPSKTLRYPSLTVTPPSDKLVPPGLPQNCN